MSIAISAQAISDEAVSRLRIPTPTAFTAYTATEMLDAIQDAARALAALRRQHLGEDFDLLVESSLATVANTSTVALPASFGELHRLVWRESTTHLVEVGECPVYELEPAAFNPRAWQIFGEDQPRYRVLGANLQFRPCPNAVYSLTVWGTTIITLASLAASFAGRPDEDEWMVLEVCERVAVSKKRDATPFSGAKAMLAENLFSADRRIAPQSRQVIRDVWSERSRRRWWRGFIAP